MTTFEKGNAVCMEDFKSNDFSAISLDQSLGALLGQMEPEAFKKRASLKSAK